MCVTVVRLGSHTEIVIMLPAAHFVTQTRHTGARVALV